MQTYAEYLTITPLPESPEKAEGGAVGGRPVARLLAHGGTMTF